jgi:hypothetical protein
MLNHLMLNYSMLNHWCSRNEKQTKLDDDSKTWIEKNNLLTNIVWSSDSRVIFSTWSFRVTHSSSLRLFTDRAIRLSSWRSIPFSSAERS